MSQDETHTHNRRIRLVGALAGIGSGKVLPYSISCLIGDQKILNFSQGLTKVNSTFLSILCHDLNLWRL